MLQMTASPNLLDSNAEFCKRLGRKKILSEMRAWVFSTHRFLRRVDFGFAQRTLWGTRPPAVGPAALRAWGSSSPRSPKARDLGHPRHFPRRWTCSWLLVYSSVLFALRLSSVVCGKIIRPKEFFHVSHLSSRSALFWTGAFRLLSGCPLGLGEGQLRAAGGSRGAGRRGATRATSV
jgi:hypothetical protein